MSKLPKVSIIVLNYNGKKFLGPCLSSLINTDYPLSCFELIVVDNKSSDNSISYVKETFPQVQVLELDKNYGYTGGNNRGAQVANGELVAFVNTDTMVERDWLMQLVRIMNSDGKIGLCGSKIAFLSNPRLIQYAGAYIHPFGCIFLPFHGAKAAKESYFAGSISGTAFLARKSVFEKIGGFDEDFFLYCDETDLSIRCWLEGFSVVYCPGSVVYHHAGGTATRSSVPDSADVINARLISPESIYHGNKNSIALAIKNYQRKNVLQGLLFSYAFMLYQIFGLCRINPKAILLLLKAHFWPLKNFRVLWKKRLAIQQNRQINDAWLANNHLFLSLGCLLKLTIQLRNDKSSLSRV